MENECAKYDLELSSMLCKGSVCAQYKHLKVENWPMKQCLEFNRINILLILTAGILVGGGYIVAILYFATWMHLDRNNTIYSFTILYIIY